MGNKIDVLDREEFINKLKLLVEMLANKKQGCCFGIDGAWGSGKSFVLEMLEERLREMQLEETADNKYFVFHYDCWKYDYYEEPAIAIISAMQDVAKEEISLFTESTSQNIKLAWRTVETTLGKIAGEFCKNKIGVDLVDIAKDVLKENDEQKDSNKEFDKLYGFKRALQSARENIQKIAKNKTVVIVVDELDRCLPTYSIKVLERLHHIFVDIDNVIIIVSMDKSQLEHSIKEIYGDIEVDKYLRKFISFKVNLAYGSSNRHSQKYATYFSLFKNIEEEKERIDYFLTDILLGIDIRTQERIFNKAELIHNIICCEKVYDCSILTFEILYLTAIMLAKSKDVAVLVSGYSYNGSTFGLFFNKIKKYRNGMRKDSQEICYVKDNCIEKAIYYLANLYNPCNDGYCLKYYYNRPVDDELDFLERFKEFTDIIEFD